MIDKINEKCELVDDWDSGFWCVTHGVKNDFNHMTETSMNGNGKAIQPAVVVHERSEMNPKGSIKRFLKVLCRAYGILTEPI